MVLQSILSFQSPGNPNLSFPASNKSGHSGLWLYSISIFRHSRLLFQQIITLAKAFQYDPSTYHHFPFSVTFMDRQAAYSSIGISACHSILSIFPLILRPY